MEIALTTVEAESVRTVWELHHLTDVHHDDPDHAAEEFASRVKHIAETPNALWMGGGDYGSLILPGDPRFQTSSDEVHRLPDLYVERCCEMLAPIADKCVGLGSGNHEATIGKYYHRGVVPEFASRLGIADKYLGVRGWGIITFRCATRRMPLRTFQYHGWSAGRLKGRKALQAERDLGAWDADVMFLGHDHQPYADIWYTERAYNPGGRAASWRLKHKPRAVINGGSWTFGQRPPLRNKSALKAHEFPNEGWSEGRNFRPQPPASPYLMVYADFGHPRADARPSGGGPHPGRQARFEFEIRFPAAEYDVGGTE